MFRLIEWELAEASHWVVTQQRGATPFQDVSLRSVQIHGGTSIQGELHRDHANTPRKVLMATQYLG